MPTDALSYDPKLARQVISEIMERSGQNILACYQCRRCAAGCPVGQETGVTPDRLIRMILMGERDEALDNLLVWKCVACYTCGARCPNTIQTSRITEALKHISKKEGLKPLVPAVAAFHDAFTASAGKFGRVSEMDFMRDYETRMAIQNLKSGEFKAIVEELLAQASLGLKMLANKRLHMGSEKIKGRDEITRLFKAAKETSGPGGGETQ